MRRCVLVTSVEYLRDWMFVVDRHDLGPQSVVGRMERQRQADLSALLSETTNSRDPANGANCGVAGGYSKVGQAFTGLKNVVKIHHRFAHAHEDAVVDVLDAPQVESLIQDLVGS